MRTRLAVCIMIGIPLTARLREQGKGVVVQRRARAMTHTSQAKEPPYARRWGSAALLSVRRSLLESNASPDGAPAQVAAAMPTLLSDVSVGRRNVAEVLLPATHRRAVTNAYRRARSMSSAVAGANDET